MSSRMRNGLRLMADICSVVTGAFVITFILIVGIGGRSVPAPQVTATAAPRASRSLGPIADVSKQGLKTSLPPAARRPGTAKIALIEFADFECPFCGRHARDVMPRIVTDFVDTGDVAYAFRHYPITTKHALALGASRAAECAGQLGKYWEMHDLLFATPAAISESEILRKVARLGLPQRQFVSCVESASFPQIDADVQEARKLGVSSTPVFFIGTLASDGVIDVETRVQGALPYDTFAQLMRSAIASTR